MRSLRVLAPLPSARRTMAQYPSQPAGFEEGPKNPLKGTSMKPLVSASYAQSGVDAVGRRFCACGGRAVSNGMEKMTRSLWRLDIVQRRTPFVVSDRCTIPDMNLHCGATRPLCRERCVQRSLPCVGNSDRRTTYRLRPRAKYDRSLKFFLQKRIRNGVTPGWKSPRLSQGQRKGYSAD